MCELILVQAWIFAVFCVCLFVLGGWLLVLNKNDKTQSILDVDFGGRLFYTRNAFELII